MLEAVICARCGAKVREDRVSCLRCGARLVSARAIEPTRPSALRTRILAGGAVIAIAGLIGIVATRPGTPAAATAGVGSERPQSAPPAAAAPETQAAARVPVTAIDSTRPGAAAYLRGDVASSVEHFRQAVETDPDNAEALNNLGQVLVRSGRADQALTHFDRAIALAPDTWAYHFNRARAYGELRQWGAAVAGYRNALQLFPEDYATAFNLAKALQSNGDLSGAITAFEKAIELAPGQPDFHLSHAFALETGSRGREAVAAYKRFLELAPESPEADKVKGRIAVLERQPTALASSPDF